MNDDYERRMQFAHRFFTPITSLQAGLALLERQLRSADDTQYDDLLGLLGRASQRLRAAVEMLETCIVDSGNGLHLHIPDQLLLERPASPPVAEQPAATPRKLIAPDPGSGAMCVLLIEDSALYRSVMSSKLEAAGYRVITAPDGTSGLDLAREQKPDVIILDLMLPELTGERVAFVLSEDPETKHIPIVIYTGLEPEDRAPLDPRLHVIHKNDALDHLPALLDQLIAERQRPPAAQILVIEGDPGVLGLLETGLTAEGFFVTTASIGADGLRLAQGHSFDLIVLDVGLPDMDGLDVLRQIRSWNQTATTPTMLLSVRASSEEKVRGLQLGADDYMSKPFDWKELTARIRASLRRREMEGSANPSTMLPGNKAIERAIMTRVDMGIPFAVGYADLNNFKAYNDCYGFLKGDAMIHQTAQIITAVVEQHGHPGDFVGHIGGDDFVFVTSPELIVPICTTILAEFDQLAPLYYSPTDRQRGWIEQLDREGRLKTFPLAGLSIAVVSSLNHTITHFAQVADLATEIKKRAKSVGGSVYIVDDIDQVAADISPA